MNAGPFYKRMVETRAPGTTVYPCEGWDVLRSPAVLGKEFVVMMVTVTRRPVIGIVGGPLKIYEGLHPPGLPEIERRPETRIKVPEEWEDQHVRAPPKGPK